MKTPYLSWEKQTIFITLWYALLSIAYCVFFMVKWLWNILFSLFTQNKCSICSPPIDSFICFSIFIGKQANPCVFHIHEFCRAKKKKENNCNHDIFFLRWSKWSVCVTKMCEIRLWFNVCVTLCRFNCLSLATTYFIWNVCLKFIDIAEHED